MQSALIVRQRLVQRAMAAHVGDIEGQALVESRLGGFADEGRRGHVAFAIPERDDVAEFARPQRQTGDGFRAQVADLRANAGKGKGWIEQEGIAVHESRSRFCEGAGDGWFNVATVLIAPSSAALLVL